jgi:endo-1,4-beta-xylanase
MLTLCALLGCAFAVSAPTSVDGNSLSDFRKKLPVAGVLMFDSGVDALKVRGESALVQSERLNDATVPSGRILRVKVSRPGTNAYEAEVQTTGQKEPIRKGDVLILRYWVRSPAGGRETGEASWQTIIQLNREPWTGLASTASSAGKNWRELFLSCQADRDFEAGTVQVTLHIASQAQTLEFAEFDMLNLGSGVDIAKLPFTSVSYEGRESNAAWRKVAAERIDKHRKAAIRLQVVDRRGRPVPKAKLHLVLREHEYVFGSFTSSKAGEIGVEGDRYRAEMERMFNRMTVPIYWADWGWESAESRATYMRILEWCKRENLRMKAHCLIWPSQRFSPTRLQPLLTDASALRKSIFEAMDERLAVLKPYAFENIDVLNELKSETEFASIVGDDLYRESFVRSAKTWPKADQVYNDYSVFESGGNDVSSQAAWEDRVRLLIRQKAPVTMLGWQAHFGETLTPPTRVWELLDRYAAFRLPFEITEFDVETRDEQAQADYTRDLLTAWFAHPSTRGFTMWGFWEGDHWKPVGAMFRKDWSPKPMAKVWVELTRRKWWTDVQTVTDGKGRVQLRGFKGKYSAILTFGGRSKQVDFTLGDKGYEARIVAP